MKTEQIGPHQTKWLNWHICYLNKRIIELEPIIAARKEAALLLALSGEHSETDSAQRAIAINENQLKRFRDDLARATSDLEKLKAP
jgi:hypothetical protein